MRQITSREIAACVLTMSTNFLRWHKTYIEKSCNIKAGLMEHNLTIPQLQILFFLRMNPKIRTVSALSAELFISKGSLSLMLTKLEKNARKGRRWQESLSFSDRPCPGSFERSGGNSVEKHFRRF